MAHNKFNAVVDDFVGYGNRLFWIASIVVFLRFKQQLFAVNIDTAFSVDVATL